MAQTASTVSHHASCCKPTGKSSAKLRAEHSCCCRPRGGQGLSEAAADGEAGLNTEFRPKVITALLPHMIPMSCNKFGSNVVEVRLPACLGSGCRAGSRV